MRKAVAVALDDLLLRFRPSAERPARKPPSPGCTPTPVERSSPPAQKAILEERRPPLVETFSSPRALRVPRVAPPFAVGLGAPCVFHHMFNTQTQWDDGGPCTVQLVMSRRIPPARLSLRLPTVILNSRYFLVLRPFLTEPIHDGDHLVQISTGILVNRLIFASTRSPGGSEPVNIAFATIFPSPASQRPFGTKICVSSFCLTKPLTRFITIITQSVTDTRGPSSSKRFTPRVS